MPLTFLSEIMGHSSLKVTQDVYIHLFERDRQEDAFRTAMAVEGLSS